MQIKKVGYNVTLVAIFAIVTFFYMRLTNNYNKLQKEAKALSEEYQANSREYSDFSKSLNYAWKMQKVIGAQGKVPDFNIFDSEKNFQISEVLSYNRELCLFVTKTMCDLCIHDILQTLEKLGLNNRCKVFIESTSKRDLALYDTKAYSDKFQYFGYNNADFLKSCEKPVLVVTSNCRSIDSALVHMVGFYTRTESWIASISGIVGRKCI